MRRPDWIARHSLEVLALASVVALGGCAAESTDGPVQAVVVASSSSPSIFGGAKDDDTQALPGVVALRVGTGVTFELCSGALLAPNLVLTARHCVTKTVSSSVSCDENGRSANGPHVSSDESPKDIGVYVGANPTFSKLPDSSGRAVVAPTGPYLCDSDIALLVLETPITTVAPLPLRLHTPAQAGELIRSVGYGLNDKASPIGTRFRRTDVEVLAQGKAVSASKTPLGPHEFEVGTSICQGDSGGPAISEETGAVIGVVSRGGGCDDAFGHIYTTTAGFDAMFADAFKLAGTTPTIDDTAFANGTSTRAKAATSSGTDEQGSASAASCSMAGRSNRRTGGGAGLVLVLGGIVALGARAVRRRRVG